MLPLKRAPLGITISLLSGVVRVVLTMDTVFTVPIYPCASMKSPDLKGLNARIIMPPAKFCTVPLRAMPIAIPPAARSAASEVVFTPRVLMETIISSTVRVMDTRLNTKDASVLSVWRLVNRPMSSLRTRFISHAPTQ